MNKNFDLNTIAKVIYDIDYKNLSREEKAVSLIVYANNVAYSQGVIVERAMNPEEIERAMTIHRLVDMTSVEFIDIENKLQKNKENCFGFIHKSGIIYNETVH